MCHVRKSLPVSGRGFSDSGAEYDLSMPGGAANNHNNNNAHIDRIRTLRVTPRRDMPCYTVLRMTVGDTVHPNNTQ